MRSPPIVKSMHRTLKDNDLKRAKARARIAARADTKAKARVSRWRRRRITIHIQIEGASKVFETCWTTLRFECSALLCSRFVMGALSSRRLSPESRTTAMLSAWRLYGLSSLMFCVLSHRVQGETISGVDSEAAREARDNASFAEADAAAAAVAVARTEAHESVDHQGEEAGGAGTFDDKGWTREQRASLQKLVLEHGVAALATKVRKALFSQDGARKMFVAFLGMFVRWNT